MPKIKRLESSLPPLRFGMSGITFSILCNDIPDCMDLRMLTQEMVRAKDVRRKVPDSHRKMSIANKRSNQEARSQRPEAKRLRSREAKKLEKNQHTGGLKKWRKGTSLGRAGMESGII